MINSDNALLQAHSRRAYKIVKVSGTEYRVRVNIYGVDQFIKCKRNWTWMTTVPLFENKFAETGTSINLNDEKNVLYFR